MITREEYLKALEIVHQYTSQQIRNETLSDEKLVMESKRINAIRQKVIEIIEHFKMTNTRHRNIVSKRQAMMWWLRQNTNFSLYEIGSMFGGYDHATVLHACKKHEELVGVKDADYLYCSDQVIQILEPYKKVTNKTK